MFSEFYKSRNGNVAMMFGIFIFMIFLAGGMGLDLQRANLIRADLQESADAGLLAAVRQKMSQPNLSNAEVKNRARQFFEANREISKSVTVNNFDIIFDSKNETFKLSFSADIDTLLLSAVGRPTLERNVLSHAKLGKPPYLEIVMALDNTGSMKNKGKLSDLKKSAKSLVDSIFAHPDADVKIGLVPFAQYVNIGTSYSGASWLLDDPAFVGCAGSRAYPANTEDTNYLADKIPALTVTDCPPPLLPMTSDKDKISKALKDMKANGWTYIPSGLVWGWRALSSDAPLSEGATYSDLKKKGGIKALVLMTDGENTRSPDYPAHNGTDITLANKLTAELCVAIKKQEIIVYTIAFQVTDTTVKFLLEDCGTTPGHYYDAENSADLEAAFDSIASSLRSISISR